MRAWLSTRALHGRHSVAGHKANRPAGVLPGRAAVAYLTLSVACQMGVTIKVWIRLVSNTHSFSLKRSSPSTRTI